MKINKIKEMSSPELEKELGELKSELLISCLILNNSNLLNSPSSWDNILSSSLSIFTLLAWPVCMSLTIAFTYFLEISFIYGDDSIDD